MQNLICYVNAKNTKGDVRDYLNLQSASAPVLTRTSEAAIKFRVFPDANTSEQYPISELTSIISWSFVMDDDFDHSSTPIISADSSLIEARSVTDTINGTSYTFSEIYVPISSMNTAELIAILGTKESVTLNGELVGFDGDGNAVFILQIMGFTVRNRMSTSGSPTPVQPEYLTAAETRALIASGVNLQYSINGSSLWHDTQDDADKYIRFRSSTSASAAWSSAIKLAKGVQGDAGEPGADGAGLLVDAFGVLADRPEVPDYYPFCFYGTDTNLFYFYATHGAGESWSSGVSMGAVSMVNSKTGNVVLAASDVNAVPISGGTMSGDLTVTVSGGTTVAISELLARIEALENA